MKVSIISKTVTIIFVILGVRYFRLFCVVTSNSMVPTLYKNDLILSWPTTDLDIGDIVIFSGNRPIDVVHRLVFKIDDMHFITKGDANLVDDIVANITGPEGIPRDKIFGKVWGRIPLVGIFKNQFEEYAPWSYLAIGAMELWPWIKK